jgi:hypothetical protein
MPSTYLTSAHLRAIERILTEVHPSLVQGTERQEAAARFLIERFRGESEVHMRAIVEEYMSGLDSHEIALAQWNNEGGAIGKFPRTEARRRIDNDTAGVRRRDRDTAERHRLI